MNQVPAWWNKRPAGFGAEDFLSGIGTSLPPHLSIANNRFTLVDGAGNARQPTMTIDVCIIAANGNASRIYYDPNTAFDPTGANNSPPLCWSDNGTGPSRNAAQPQSQTCATCPKSIWGSAQSRLTGKGIPACQQNKKVAVLVPSDSDDILYMFKIPPASLKHLATYVKTLAGNKISGRAVMPSDVVTRLEFESQGVVKFAAVSLIDDDMFNRSERYYAQQDLIAQVTGRDDVARDPTLPIGSIVSEGLQQAPPIVRQPAPLAAPQTMAFMPKGETIAPPKRGRPAAKPVEKKDEPLEVPAFLKRSTNESAPKAVGPGMVSAPEPSDEISQALSSAFNLPGV
jgi:hypothetical protein